jgi:parvulin-like peptidyl-prolyl isomerase
MRKKFSELVEDKPASDEPEEVSASHILLKFKDVDKGSTRTKAEAKKLAEELIAKAKKKGADFAALARKHSEGPTNTKGGDLGSFKRGKMVKEFDNAVFKLKVGDISGIVETEFGFHIIKRTK